MPNTIHDKHKSTQLLAPLEGRTERNMKLRSALKGPSNEVDLCAPIFNPPIKHVSGNAISDMPKPSERDEDDTSERPCDRACHLLVIIRVPLQVQRRYARGHRNGRSDHSPHVYLFQGDNPEPLNSIVKLQSAAVYSQSLELVPRKTTIACASRHRGDLSERDEDRAAAPPKTRRSQERFAAKRRRRRGFRSRAGQCLTHLLQLEHACMC